LRGPSVTLEPELVSSPTTGAVEIVGNPITSIICAS
jgi:hypothetical protein